MNSPDDSAENTASYQCYGEPNISGVPTGENNARLTHSAPINDNPRTERPRKRANSAKHGQTHTKGVEDDSNDFLVMLQQKCFENYHTVAYTLIIGSVSCSIMNKVV